MGHRAGPVRFGEGWFLLWFIPYPIPLYMDAHIFVCFSFESLYSQLWSTGSILIPASILGGVPKKKLRQLKLIKHKDFL